MIGKKAPHEVLTDPKNQRILGTFTPRAWAKLSVLEARARFFDTTLPPEQIAHPLAGMIDVARQTSGAIAGEHRKDVVEAIRGANAPTVGLAVPAREGEKAAETTTQKRGI